MFTKLCSMGILGINSFLVEIETDISKGLPGFDIVGLPDASIKESRDRVRSAIKNCGYEFPLGKIIVNLAPADVRKYGPIYELPILISILSSTDQLKCDLSSSVFVGEVSLKGDIRPVIGALSMSIKAKELGIKNLYLPLANANEASVVTGINIYGVKHVDQLIAHLVGNTNMNAHTYQSADKQSFTLLDFADVKGQSVARRALEIAAAGGHNCLLIGSPGAGKSMLAKRLPSILPKMTLEESIETTRIYSISGNLPSDSSLINYRPFRSPHHTVSAVGMAGGGNIPKPGEISLAHNGVLFLDELPEFSRSSMEVLRQPVEDGYITISRVNGTLTYPASIMLVAAMNPCPCGYFGHPNKECTCSPNSVSRYLSKISGPLLDRIDLHIDTMPVEFNSLVSNKKSESSACVKERVDYARKLQVNRFRNFKNINCNSRIPPGLIQDICKMTPESIDLLKNVFDKLSLSARAYDKILKVARTIADLSDQEIIQLDHIAEAIRYRSLDRKYWLQNK